MAHHIGMSLVALTNVLSNNIWQRRFHADPLVRSAELLLHERIPRRLVVQEPQDLRPDEAMPEADTERPSVRELDTPDTAQPHIALLGHVALYHHGEPLRRRVQPLRGAGGDPLAVGRHPRLHRPVLLPQGPLHRSRMVGGAPAGMRGGRQVPGAAGDRPGDLPPRSMARSRPAPRSQWCRRTPPRFGGSPSPTTAMRLARSS